MRRVGVSQNEYIHFVSNPRKLTYNYHVIVILRYRDLNPAPLTMLGNLRLEAALFTSSHKNYDH